tara:strand:+ start:25284 stop:25496 length:213 start_codon:yes stop_codon:yes gene_type:complete
MTTEKIALRASDKLEAQLFFANKKLEEYELYLAGVIPTNIDSEDIEKMIKSQKSEIEVLSYMFNLVELSY